MHMRWQMRALRRGSVLGPILLIGAGIVFLLIQTGRVDRHEFIESYAHWWPLLLVGAGLVVLAEWGLDQLHMSDPDRPQYRRSIGGGAIVLLLFFAFAGICADTGVYFSRVPNAPNEWGVHVLGVDQNSWEEFFGDKHESDQALDLPLAAGSSLAVVNPRGDVTVTGTSDDGRVHIAMHKEIFVLSDSDADSRAQLLTPATKTDGDMLRITMPSLDGARADMTITVPPDAATTVNAGRGDIHVASVKAAVTVTANRGGIDLSAITGPVTADINNGGSSLSAHNLDGGITIQGRARDITLADISGPVSINGDVYGSTHLERLNGAVHFHTSRSDIRFARLDGAIQISGSGISADQAQGPMVLATSNRNLNLDRMAGDIAVTDPNGAIDLTVAPVSGGSQLGNITIVGRNRSIKATLPEHAGFSITAATTNGDIDTDFSFEGTGGQEASTQNGDSRGSQRTLNGTVAPGGPTVRITTANGDISIMKGDVQPLTPPAPPEKITSTPVAPAPAKAARIAKTPKVAAPAALAAPATPNQ